MYESNQQTGVQYIRDSQKINLILPGEECLDQIGYKVLQNAAGASLLCGYKSLYNGKVKLTYEISKYASLAALLPQLTYEQLTGILCDLLSVVEQVYDIGFLQYENISLQADDIFLNTTNYKVSLLYFPVKTHGELESRAEFEQRLRQEVHKLIYASPLITQARMHRLDDAFQSGARLCELKHQLQDGLFTSGRDTDPGSLPPERPSDAGSGRQERAPGLWQRLFGQRKGARRAALLLVGEGTPEPVSIRLTGGEQLVGKNPQLGQGAILFNRTISRRHCKFIVGDDGCFLVDLNSANGTFLNEARLTPQVPYPVKPGDKIRLANSRFLLTQG